MLMSAMEVVSGPRVAVRRAELQLGRRPLVGRLHIRRAPQPLALRGGGERHRSALPRASGDGNPDRRFMAGTEPPSPPPATLCSTPQISLQEAKSLPDFNKIQFSRMEAIPLEQLVPDASADAVSLLGSLLTYREKDRISAEEVSWSHHCHIPVHPPPAQALLHRFFFTEPFPSTPADLVQHIPLQSRSSQPPFDVNAAFSLPLEDRAPTASGEA